MNDITKYPSVKLQIVPVSFKDACKFITDHHRHLKPPVGHKYSIATQLHNRIVAVIIVGRPIARLNDDGFTLEVLRLATDNTFNACSMLYAAAWRVARNLGYRKLITYILSTEKGTSLKASGFKVVSSVPYHKWSCPSRLRYNSLPEVPKLKFEKTI